MNQRSVQGEIQRLLGLGYTDESATEVARRHAYTADIESYWEVLLHTFVIKLAERPVTHPDTIDYGNQIDGIKLYDGREVKITVLMTVPAAEPVPQSRRNLR